MYFQFSVALALTILALGVSALLIGLQKPDSGCIRIEGQEITALEGKKTSEDAAEIRTAAEDLSKELSKVYEAVQKAAAAEPNSAEQTPPGAEGQQNPGTDTPPAGNTPPEPQNPNA